MDCWGHATTSLKGLSAVYSQSGTAETIGRVNRLISAWPTDDTLPTEGLVSLKATHAKLSSGLGEIMNLSKQEAA
jgi:SAGA-associated factor 29